METENKTSVRRATGLSRFSPFVVLRTLYDWVIRFAETPHGTWALFLIALAESSFFPIPPDILLIALALAAPSRSLWFAFVSTAGSLIGAVVGYGLGYQFYELLGKPIVDFYAAEATYNQLKELYETWDVWAVGIAGFTPVPYKVVTITAGAFKINFATFMLVSAISRAARFFLVGGLIQWFGPSIKPFIDRYFNLLCMVFMVLLLGGFLLLKYVF
jgi:membrane protein YqaA with SNARE-associated domain